MQVFLHGTNPRFRESGWEGGQKQNKTKQETAL